MWFVIVGGAPLSKETHEFIRTCLGLTIVQGYRYGRTHCVTHWFKWLLSAIQKRI